MNQETGNSAGGGQGEETLFALALKLPLGERHAYLDEACLHDASLRARVEALLQAHDATLSALDEGCVTLKDDEGIDLGPGEAVGRYKLLERLGEGGCGVVYVAEQTEPVRRRVALKVIKLGMDTKQVVARFEAERQALAMMDHPNIARVLDAGTTEQGRPYFVMELVRGIKITDYCDQEKIETAERLQLFTKVCHAIQHAHQKGIIHRDIKPSNILVTLHDGVPVPKVIDFGIAKATEGRALTDATVYTQLHQFIGTPAYMSPEQAEMSGLDIDTRSDIYSLGVLLYELLTSKTPFDGQELISMGVDAMRQAIREKEPTPPSSKLATLPGADLTSTAKRRSVDTSKLVHQLKGDLDWIVMKCLEKDRQRRYDTANGLAADITRHLDNEAVVARPPSRTYQLQKAWRRNKVVYTAAAIVIGALVAGLALSVIGFQRAVMAQRSEEAAKEQANTNAAEAETAKDAAEQNEKKLAYALYLHRVQQAYRDLEANRPADALALLEECPESLRAWEWHYLRNRCDKNVLEVHHLGGKLPSAAPRRESIVFSPNGRDVAAIFNGQLQVWDLSQARSKPLHQLGPISNQSYRRIAFSPSGSRIAAVTHEGRVKLWEVATGKELQSFPIEDVIAIFPKEGGVVWILHGEGTLSIGEIETGDLKPYREPVGTARHPETGVEYAYHGAKLSPDGRYLAGAVWSGFSLWDIEAGKRVFQTPAHDTPIDDLAFSPDGSVVATTDNAIVRLWEVATGKSLGTLSGHKSWVMRLSFSSDGTRLVSGAMDRQIKIWDWQAFTEVLTLTNHENTVTALLFTEAGKVMSSDADGVVRVWDGSARTRHERLAHEILRGHRIRVWRVVFTSDGRLVSCAEDGKGLLWDLDNLNSPPAAFTGIFDVDVSPDGRHVLSAHGVEIGEGNFPHVVRVLDARTLEERDRVGVMGTTFSATWSPDGQWIATAGYDLNEAGEVNVLVWPWHETDTVQAVGTHRSPIMDVEFSPDGRYLASASADGEVQLRRVADFDRASEGRVLQAKSAERELLEIAFSPDSQRLATGDGFHDVVIYDVETGHEVMRLQGHGELVISVDYSPDGRLIASGSADNTVRVWDAKTGELLRTLLGHPSIIYSVAFSPDSRKLASGGLDANIRLWDISGVRTSGE